MSAQDRKVFWEVNSGSSQQLNWQHIPALGIKSSLNTDFPDWSNGIPKSLLIRHGIKLEKRRFRAGLVHAASRREFVSTRQSEGPAEGLWSDSLLPPFTSHGVHATRPLHTHCERGIDLMGNFSFWKFFTAFRSSVAQCCFSDYFSLIPFHNASVTVQRMDTARVKNPERHFLPSL